ncbi:MAG: LysR family transcriptional regulator, partial [Simplicispira sp.]|nr:LysR family transcriptional regulator [Simplicispira sp.]
MDLRQLGYFVRVVELGSLTRAATVLRIAQPALGIQIKKLEVEFGAPLLVRHSRGVEPTDVGALLFEQAKALLTSADAI